MIKAKYNCLPWYVPCIILLFYSISVVGAEYKFRSLNVENGLADSHVNRIFKSKDGYLWFGTDAGLSRYDGFRFKNFYSRASDVYSLNSSQIFDIQEDHDGILWVQTNEGCCIYNPKTETFDRNTKEWMNRHGMRGTPDKIFIDSQNNFWLAVTGVGCYFYNTTTREHFLFRFGTKPNDIPTGNISDFFERGKSLVITLDDGTLVRLDAFHHKVVWVNREMPKVSDRKQYYHTFIDSEYNYWVNSVNRTYVYSSRKRKWYSSVSHFLSGQGFSTLSEDFISHDIKEDTHKRLWIATEHNGLYVIDYQKDVVDHIKYDSHNFYTLPDNTIESLYIDRDGTVWIGTYKNGVAYYSPKQSLYATISLGDVCTLTQDLNGNYWCGTNESGIICMNPQSKQQYAVRSEKTKLGSDVIVSSLCTRDGALWFGAYNGGLTCYSNGTFTSFRTQTSGLSHDCVWTLAEDNNGHVLIGTLGGGLQIFDPRKRTFTTYTVANSSLPSDYISSVVSGRYGNIIVGHSKGLTIMDSHNGKMRNIVKAKDGETFSSASVNQIFEDSRGLIWNVNMCGVDVYDPLHDHIYHIYSTPKMAYAITEDRNGYIWVSLDRSIIRIAVNGDKSHWNFFITNYDELDGLQRHRYNYRSMMLDHAGNIVVGGQDGINVLPVQHHLLTPENENVIFSGVVLFDHPLNVGENYNGHVVLDASLNVKRKLDLKYSENTFSILLASSRVSIPQKTRFLYRMKGLGNENWLMTVESQPNVSYTNLGPGTYIFQVRAVNNDGSLSRNIRELTIHIAPPVWLSIWAIIIYIVVLSIILWLVWCIVIQRKMEKMRLAFLTDVSHELRTPLALVISPIKAIIQEETDPQRLSRLQLVLRNANRLLSLVNQTLDLRKIESHVSQLTCTTADIVAFVRSICSSFDKCGEKNISFSFCADRDCLMMSFDEDKMEKAICNLLSNAYKFTPDGGKINVSLHTNDHDRTLSIEVSDTGCGIGEEDKQYVFDRFYQGNNGRKTTYGGSGIGLWLVKEFVKMHGGNVYLHDNPEGGSVFTIVLPMTTIDATSKEERKVEDKHFLTKPNVEEGIAKKYEVLIVDDSEDFLSFMSEMLSSMYVVRTAVNGKDALKKVAEHKPDIILSDVMMPVMDGNEFCKAIHSDPKTERIPFIMLTARLATNNKIEGMAIGADDYITKPFNFDLLNLRIQNLIKWRNATPVGVKLQPEIKQYEVTSADEKLVKDATSFVEENINRFDLTVEMMSDYIGMSRVNLYKRLLSVTGNTPKEFIRSIRLKHAEKLLHDGQYNVSEVAYKVGFNNPKYFSKYFMEMYGVTPSQYKRNNLQQTTLSENNNNP